MKQIIVLFSILFYTILNANIIHIPDDYVEIQEAIEFSADGDTILVERGIYEENLEFETHNIILASNFIFTGDNNDISQTIIMGDSDDETILIDVEPNSSQIIGLTITNGEGGLIIENTSPTLINLIIMNNSTEDDGGGIYCKDADLSMRNCRINDNVSEDEGGGLYIESSEVDIRNCRIYNNSADSQGGGFYIENTEGSLQNIFCEDNISWEEDGGGLALVSIVDLSIVNALISGNEAKDNGGGVYCSNSTILFTNLTVMGNSSTDDDGNGGGIYCSSSDATIINSVIANNLGDSGIYASSCQPNVSYNNVFNNEEDNFHGFDNGVGEITSVNRNGEECDAFFNIQYSPDFVFVNNEYYHPSDNSVLVNAGSDNTSFLADFDLAGETRLYGEYVDMGAYENQNVQVVGIPNLQLPITNVQMTNYPNPFNPSTTISFSVTQSSDFATLEIYNLKGQKVKSFSNLQITQSTKHQIVWDGTEQTGKSVSSGIYFAKLKAGNVEANCKMLLLK